MMRVAVIVLALAVLAVACSDDGAESPGEGRLVTIDATGNVVTMAPDGTDATPVTDDAGGRVTYFQPIWSPDASHLSVTRSEAGTFTVDVIDVADGTMTSTPTASNAFYAYWSPDGRQLGYLSSVTPQDLALDIITVGSTEAPQRAGLGQPLYFSWSPESVELVGHIGADRLEILTVEAVEPDLGRPGEFLAPQWTDQGIVYVGVSGGRQQLVQSDRGGDTDLLASLSGRGVFTATPDGRRIAILSTGGNDLGSTVAAQQAPLLPAGRLVVLDEDDDGYVEVDVEIAVAFSWDPMGQRLLILEVTEAGAVRWQVWADGELQAYPEFSPAPSFVRDLVPFFDQYAQSMTLWSPDGSAFAYPGTVDGVDGIWVQELEADRPTNVGTGTWVAWSSG